MCNIGLNTTSNHNRENIAQHFSNLSLNSFQLIEKEFQYKSADDDMRIEFSEPIVLLELPKGKIGEGWELKSGEPTQASDHN